MPGHPESPERVLGIFNFLKEKGFEFLKPEPCKENDLLRVHSREMVEEVRNESFTNYETPSHPNIYRYACLSAGSAVQAMELVLKGENSFSLMRPPGHHAGKASFEGFCYFNNICIAVSKILKKKKACVLDIDCHHGNGSEEILRGLKNAIYISLHQYGSFYPGTGGSSFDNIHNFPLPSGTGEREYLEKLKEAIEIIRKFNPEIIGVSAGFDTYKGDPITNMDLDVDSYGKISGMISKLGEPIFTVLEGGYSEKLPECVYSYLNGLK